MTLEEFIKIVHDFIGDDTSERALKFVDDVTNAFNSAVSGSSSSDNEDWHKKYDELDEAWRKKYMHRFFNGDVNFDTNDADDDETHETTAETITTEDLFNKEEE